YHFKHLAWVFSICGILCASIALAQTGNDKTKPVKKASAYSQKKNFDISFLDKIISDDSDFLFDPNLFGKNYLLLIACDKYKFWKSLKNAVKDARDVRRILINKYGFESDNIYELYNEDVTVDNMKAQFEALVSKSTNQDNLLIYYSGHGFYDASFDLGYWVPHDGRTNSNATATYFPNDLVRDYIKQMNFKHVFLVADACFSGSLFADDLDTRGVEEEKLESIKSRWGLSSGNLETVLDAAVIEGKKLDNSPFAHFFTDYLTNNLQEYLPVKQLIEYVKAQVKENTEQEPLGAQLNGVGSEGGQFVFKFEGEAEEKDSRK
ncbi:MAG: caspase family protein, partial [Bacteroidota bacterium]